MSLLRGSPGSMPKVKFRVLLTLKPLASLSLLTISVLRLHEAKLPRCTKDREHLNVTCRMYFLLHDLKMVNRADRRFQTHLCRHIKMLLFFVSKFPVHRADEVQLKKQHLTCFYFLFFLHGFLLSLLGGVQADGYPIHVCNKSNKAIKKKQSRNNHNIHRVLRTWLFMW